MPKIDEHALAVMDVAVAIKDEAVRAMELHPPMCTPHEAYAVILEELDEFWDYVKTNPKKLSDEQQQVRLREMRKELVQTGAMCLRAIVELGL